ncbi:dihydrofolate reductase family protein [Microbacterium sp. USHLN186]|uniref:dihydrofolate reductase family protein n=1 Tax=Microbacterium sp. USHLN186 TaxID=3081286 RepID=UPI003015A68A
MGTLSYTASISLDGYVADAQGDFNWSGPNDEVFQLHIDRMSQLSAEVLGRHTYLLMRYWEQEPDEGWDDSEREFARRWQGLDHVVVSTTLSEAEVAPDDRLVPGLKLPALQRLVHEATGEVEIFGPTTAADAIRAGMVADFRFFVFPKVVGGGLAALPSDTRLDLQLVEHRVFEDGVAYLHYRSPRTG